MVKFEKWAWTYDYNIYGCASWVKYDHSFTQLRSTTKKHGKTDHALILGPSGGNSSCKNSSNQNDAEDDGGSGDDGDINNNSSNK